MGKGRPAAVPFFASSSLTPHHFLSTGSMAASSASAVCAVSLEVPEVLHWFSDPSQKKEVFNRFVKAQSATEQHPDAWPREKWVRACINMRAVMVMEAELSGQAFEMVCTLLEQHSKALEENPRNCQPGHHQPRGSKAKRQERADQQPSAWPDPVFLLAGKGMRRICCRRMLL